MKAVLISIQPKWVEKIASGEKTIEVRKSRPKLETPFKCYIYCTIGNGVKGDYLVPSGIQCGKVIGEFVCKGIMRPFDCLKLMAKQSCLTENELLDYSNGKTLYGWRIADLKIYDKPKELSEFRKYYECGNNSCGSCDKCDKDYHLTRPPQSWCYVEELQNG